MDSTINVKMTIKLASNKPSQVYKFSSSIELYKILYRHVKYATMEDKLRILEWRIHPSYLDLVVSQLKRFYYKMQCADLPAEDSNSLDVS
jgi:hypothetical protein